MTFLIGDIVKPRAGARDRGVVVTVKPIYVMWKRAKATYMEDASELVLIERNGKL